MRLTQKHSNGQICEFRHYENDRLHNESGPALGTFDEKGRKLTEEFLENGAYRPHEKGPSRIEYHKNGRVKKKEWLVDRGDKPQTELYHKNGTVAKLQHSEAGAIHRNGAPAVLIFDDQGRLRAEIWAQLGVAHRDDGPCSVFYDEFGVPTKLRFARNGKEHDATAHERVFWMRKRADKASALAAKAAANRIVQAQTTKKRKRIPDFQR